MGSQQSQLLNNQPQQQPHPPQQQPGQGQHHPYHHFLTKRPSTVHLERSSTPFLMNKICRSSLQSYPYPRTHTLVVMPPPRPIIEDDTEESFEKARPPLNRAIPPIPESRSNDSIITHVSERHSESHAEPIPSTSRVIRQPSRSKPLGQAVAPRTAKDASMSSKTMENDGSLVIENKMAQNLATKTAVIVSSRRRQPENVPRSPLMSVAHSVRTRLTKLGSRFSRSDTNQNIRTSASLSSMRRDYADKVRDVPVNTRFKKSASMETRATQNSASSDSIKSAIQMKPTPSSCTPSVTKTSATRLSENNQPASEPSDKVPFLNQNRLLKPSRPKNLPSRKENSLKESPVLTAFKVHLEPRIKPNLSQSVRVHNILSKPRVVSSMAAKVHTSTDCESIKEIKEAKIRPTTNVITMGTTERGRRSGQTQEFLNKMNDRMGGTSRQRSFIPLQVTPLRKIPTKAGPERAPLAESESSRIGSSPAVESPPSTITVDENQNEDVNNPTAETQTISEVETSSSTSSVRGNATDQILSNESASVDGIAAKELTNCKEEDGWTPNDVNILSNSSTCNSPNVPFANGACDSDAKSGNSPNEFISPTVMTSSGFTTSSGFHESPDKSPDKDAEFDEQFSDITVTLKTGRSRSRRPPPHDLGRESVVSENSVSIRYKNKRYDEKTIAFPSVAVYESSCNDVAYIKSELLKLQTLINNADETERADKSASKDVENIDIVRRLLEENDALRKELKEKDQIISNLKAKICFTDVVTNDITS